MKRRWTLAACGALWGLAAAAQPPAPIQPPARPDRPPANLEIAVTPEGVRIGDRLQASLTLSAATPLAGPPRFPVWEQRWGAAEILAVEAPRQEVDGRWRQDLTLAVFETGEVILPAVEAQVPLADGTTWTARTAATRVPVASVLPQPAEEVKALPPEPVRQLAVGRGFWWTGAGLVLACAALGWFLWHATRQVREAVATLALSPFEALGRALERLRRETDGERLFTGLSLELRRYIGRALGFPAAEGTTTEIQRRLRDHRLPPELAREALDLLREADRVKFARRAADRSYAASRLTEAERLAARVEAWLHPPTRAIDSPETAT